jgi:thiosulfate/3-mercaptopyruvate sulfurtransferase
MRKMLLSLLLWSLWSAAYARPEFLVDADWLAEHIEDENLVVLEVRYHPHWYYTVGHIPGAVQIQRFKDLGDNYAVPLMRFPRTRSFRSACAAGV